MVYSDVSMSCTLVDDLIHQVQPWILEYLGYIVVNGNDSRTVSTPLSLHSRINELILVIFIQQCSKWTLNWWRIHDWLPDSSSLLPVTDCTSECCRKVSHSIWFRLSCKVYMSRLTRPVESSGNLVKCALSCLDYHKSAHWQTNKQCTICVHCWQQTTLNSAMDKLLGSKVM